MLLGPRTYVAFLETFLWDAEENKMPLQKKIFSPSRDFPFKPLKLLSKGLEHMFQALEHKIPLGERKNPSRKNSC